MSTAAGSVEVTFRWQTRAGPVTESFDLETITDLSDGRLLFLDGDEEPRVMLKADELADLQQRAGAEVLNQ